MTFFLAAMTPPPHHDRSRWRSELRFIVLMREPVQRTWSHYAMMALYYKWERQRDVTALMGREINQTVRCNASLALQPRLLLELPYEELAIFGKCVGSIKYLGKSLYAASLLPALRLFRRSYIHTDVHTHAYLPT